MPYTIYRSALCHQRRVHAANRDQTSTREALIFLDQLLAKYPYSEYAGEGEVLWRELRTTLAEHVRNIGDFYLKRDEYESAAERYRSLLNEYPGLGLDAEALYKLGVCYEEMNRTDEAENIFQAIVAELSATARSREGRRGIASPRRTESDRQTMRGRHSRSRPPSARPTSSGVGASNAATTTTALVAAPQTCCARRQGFADVHYMLGVLLERRDELRRRRGASRAALRINPAYAEALPGAGQPLRTPGRLRALARDRRARPREVGRARRARSTPPPAASSPTCRPRSATPTARPASRTRRSRPTARRSTAARTSTTSDYGSGSRCARRGFRTARWPSSTGCCGNRPECLDAAVQIGLTLYTLGRTEDARREWKAVLQQDPDRQDAQMYLRLVRPS